MEQRVSLITLGVADVGRSRAFYEALGPFSEIRRSRCQHHRADTTRLTGGDHNECVWVVTIGHVVGTDTRNQRPLRIRRNAEAPACAGVSGESG